LVYSNLNFVVEVATWSHSSLSKGNRKKLRQCIEANLLSRPLQPAEIPMAYELIKRNRQDIGTKISVSFQEISKNLNYYPSLYRCFGTFVENKLVAAAFTIRTWENNEYVFLWGDSIDHRNLSPVVHLCDFLVTWCSSEQVRFLDLGTASIEGQPLEGLVRFKQNLGAIIFQKQTLELSTLS
jgi:lipid II:glycine glycyltransferase (peptidoglycan interpeptide bridge formation enzyme)